MKILIKNGTIIPIDGKKERIINKDILIENDIIKAICDNYTGSYDKLIDASNKIVMPGLINSHTHLGMSIFKGTNDNLSLNDWLNNKIWPIENKLSTEDIYYSTIYGMIEMIKTGSTFANEMYIDNDAFIKAANMCKIRCMYGSNFLDISGKGDQIIDDFIKCYNENKDNDLINFAINPHSLYTCSEKYLSKCIDLSNKLNLPINMHFCENLNEVDTIKKTYQISPSNVLKKLGLLDKKVTLAHGTFIDKDELELLKGKNISVVHNPVSNLNLGCGICDITKYQKYINVCLGTDGVGSAINLNMFYHMSLVDLLQKGIYKDPTVFDSFEVLKMATINGAKALGLEKEIGSIEVGKKADIIILDLDNICSYPYPNIISNIVHNIESKNVCTTIINGNILMEDYKLLLDIDENILKEKINKIILKNNL